MKPKLNLTADNILNKKFPAKKNGYDCEEVDRYLDLVLEDYRRIQLHFERSIDNSSILEKEIKKLEKKIQDLEIKNAMMSKRFEDISLNDNVSIDNIELLQRIRALEKALHKLGVDPNKIK